MEFVKLWAAACVLVLAILPYKLALSVQAFFRGRSGLVWDNCKDSVSVSRLHCSVQCSQMNSCLGFNYDVNASSNVYCQVCLSNETKTISSSVTVVKETSMLHLRYNAVVKAPPKDSSYVAILPEGLYDGQTIVCKLKVEDRSDVMLLAFMDNELVQGEWGLSERDLVMHVTFNFPSRPYAIFLNSFNKATQKWDAYRVQKDVFDYLNLGVDSDVIILVHELDYTIYVGGKLLTVYPRTGRISLKEVIALRIHSSYNTVFL